MRIIAGQKRQLSEILRTYQLNISDFRGHGDKDTFQIEYLFDYFSFKIEKTSASDQYKLTVYPVDNMNGYSVGANWSDTIERFKKWLAGVEEEVNTVTGWETARETNVFEGGYQELNEQYSTAELNRELHDLNKFKARLLTVGLEKDKQDIIIDRLDKLEQKLDKSTNKFDWRSQLVGALFGLMITLTVPPHLQGMIWFQLKSSFRSLALGL